MIRILAFALLMLGCTKFVVPGTAVDSAFFERGESSLTPSTDYLTPHCLAAAKFDACLFAKNPVAQEKAVVPLAQADEIREFGVKLRGLATTGYLENSRVRIYSISHPRFDLSHLVDLRVYDASTSALEQFSAYYWSNRLFDYLEARLGADRVPAAGIQIYADDVFTGLSTTGNSIHLQKQDGQWPKALSAEVVVQLTAQVIANNLTSGALLRRDSTQHNLCELDPKACCKTIDGCAQSLANGFGDYVAAMMFPASPRLGETIASNTDGQKICALSRDLVAMGAQTRSQVFNACTVTGRAVLLGTWYAGIWWKLRNQLEAQDSATTVDVDQLFFDHAKVWTSTSTLLTAKAEALRLAQNYKSGKYLTAFTLAFANAGL